MKHIWIPVIHSTSIARVSGTARITGITRISDISKIPEMHVKNHVLMQLSDVCTTEFVDMSTIELPNCATIHRMDIGTIGKSHSFSMSVV